MKKAEFVTDSEETGIPVFVKTVDKTGVLVVPGWTKRGGSAIPAVTGALESVCAYSGVGINERF